MRRLTSLCNKLRRKCHVNAVVVSHCRRGHYAVYVGEFCSIRHYYFGSVHECERFLLDLFN